MTHVAVSQRTSPSAAQNECSDWFVVHRPITLIPVLPNLYPDNGRRIDGLLTELSAGGLRCTIDTAQTPVGGRWVVGVEQPDYSVYFATARCCGWRSQGAFCHGEFALVDTESDLLHPTALIPQLDSRSHRFQSPAHPDALQAWIELGVVRPILVHRVYVCPECGTVPIFGGGCGNCGSIRLMRSKLIHHFRCAHVGYGDEFLDGDDIVCPKCRTRGLVVGADFENLDGPFTCLECARTSSELEQIGTCLDCGLRFPQREALEQEITGYDVDRLVPLAIVDAS